jgi:pimeloyl-ACP methyl ester carboxylesterase/DNA-binding CsgD family transcriptional regulator
MHARTSDDVTIAYSQSGSGPTLVLLPGVPFSNFVGEWQVPELRAIYESLGRRLRIVQYDGRGTGHSQRDVSDFSLAAMLRDLDAVIAALRIERFALLGYYNSCTHALAYAARHPDRVTRLVLFGGSARGWLPMSSSQAQALLSLIEHDWGVFADTAAHQWMGWIAGEAGRLIAASFRDAATPAIARAILQAASGFDVSAELGRVTAPALVLHRAEMPQIPREISESLASALPHGQLYVLPGASPALFFENHDHAIDVITEFVTTGKVSDRPRRAVGTAAHGLTARELDVLRLLARGETNAEIARQLDLSVNTIERHVANVYRKIDARGRADATAFAVRNGLG